MRIIASCNRKGGEGKTSFTGISAEVLAKKGYRVLIVDLDSQFDLTKNFNVISNLKEKEAHRLGVNVEEVEAVSYKSLYDVLIGECSVKDAIITVDDSFYSDDRCDMKGNTKDVIADLVKLNNRKSFTGSISILPSALEVGEVLKSKLKVNPQTVLARKLKEIENDFDFCIIDTIPHEDNILYNAFVAADDIIVPCTLTENALDGAIKVNEILEVLRENELKVPDCVLGYVISNVDLVSTKKSNLIILQKLVDLAGEKNGRVFSNIIRRHPSMYLRTIDKCTILNQRLIKTSKVYDENNNVIDADDLPLTYFNLLKNKKNWVKDEETRKKIPVKKYDYTSVAKDYINVIEEYLQQIK